MGTRGAGSSRSANRTASGTPGSMISIALTGVSNPITTGAEARPSRRPAIPRSMAAGTGAVFGPPGQVRLPVTDDEIIDQALSFQPLTGRLLRFVTSLLVSCGRDRRVEIGGGVAQRAAARSQDRHGQGGTGCLAYGAAHVPGRDPQP